VSFCGTFSQLTPLLHVPWPLVCSDQELSSLSLSVIDFLPRGRTRFKLGSVVDVSFVKVSFYSVCTFLPSSPTVFGRTYGVFLSELIDVEDLFLSFRHDGTLLPPDFFPPSVGL